MSHLSFDSPLTAVTTDVQMNTRTLAMSIAKDLFYPSLGRVTGRTLAEIDTVWQSSVAGASGGRCHRPRATGLSWRGSNCTRHSSPRHYGSVVSVAQ